MALLADASCWTPDQPHYSDATPARGANCRASLQAKDKHLHSSECPDLEELVSSEGMCELLTSQAAQGST